MKKGVVICFFMFVVVTLSLVSAGNASLVNNTLKKEYVLGEKLSGTITLDLTNYSADAILKTNIGNGSIKVLDLIQANSLSEGDDYNCTKVSCLSGYRIKNEIKGNITLGGEEERYVGIQANGDGVVIKAVSLNLSGEASASCYNQLQVESFGNPEILLNNEENTGESCGKKLRGCYNVSLSNYQAGVLSSEPYCERITLPSAPGYLVGAYLTKEGTGSTDIDFQLYDKNKDNIIGECSAPINITGESEIKCIVNGKSTSKPEEFYVCVSAPDEAGIKINFEDVGNNCGLFGIGSEAFGADYNIFAESLKFGKPKILMIDELYQNNFGSSFVDYSNSYISERYGGTCSKKGGCIIPFKVSGVGQNLGINASIDYSTNVSKTGNSKVWEIEPEESLINANDLELDIGLANIEIINISSDRKLYFYLDNQSINKGIELNLTKNFDFDISPKFFPIGLDRGIQIVSSDNITASVWDFGNGGIKEGVAGKVYYKFLQSGEYEIKVQATNSKGQVSSRAFKVMAGSPAESARTLISEYNSRMSNVTVQLGTYPDKLSAKIEELIGFEELKAGLKKAEQDITVANTDEAYTNIVNQLLAMDVPRSINVNVRGEIPMIAALDNMNIATIARISAEENVNADNLKKSITSWMAKSYNAKITFEQIYAIKDSEDKPLFTQVKIDVSPKNELSEQGIYLILGFPIDTITFFSGYGEKAVESATYIPLSYKAESFEFALPGKVDPKEMGAYISPELSNFRGLSVEESKGSSIGGFLAVWWIVILIVTLILYIVLQEWYKRNYEKTLFKNPDELYNLINFIYNSRVSGMKDAEIEKKLLDAKWNKEKVRYAFNKIDGKRTGMFEIPVFKFLENKKVKEELTKRNPSLIKTQDAKKSEILPTKNKNNMQGNKGATFIKR